MTEEALENAVETTGEQVQETEEASVEHHANHTAYEVICAVGSVLFVAGLIGIAIWGLLTPDRKQSEYENRLLQQLPGFSLNVVADGSFMRDLESYMTDQFPWRDRMVRTKTYLDLLCGSEQINGVYIGRDNYLFEPQTVPDEQQMETIATGINTFCRRNDELEKAVVLAPNATCLLNDRLPYGVVQYDQREVLSELRDKIGQGNGNHYHWIDAAGILENTDNETLYYRTDHHWTTRGAYAVFQELARQWELETDGITYDFAVVSDSFQGTLASSSGICHIHDDIEICLPHDVEGQCVIEYESENRKTASFFDTEKLTSHNQYEIFMGGNFAKIVISTTAKNDKTLLVFKDSYANCMIPMLAPYFSQIIVIDPRYYNDTIDGCMQDYAVTHVLFVYNLNTFLEDKSLADVLEQ